jgi:hypothetical protein
MAALLGAATLALLSPLAASTTGQAGPRTASYRAEIRQFRQQRTAELKADDGWLTVAGLFWLKPGCLPRGNIRGWIT